LFYGDAVCILCADTFWCVVCSSLVVIFFIKLFGAIFDVYMIDGQHKNGVCGALSCWLNSKINNADDKKPLNCFQTWSTKKCNYFVFRKIVSFWHLKIAFSDFSSHVNILGRIFFNINKLFKKFINFHSIFQNTNAGYYYLKRNS
jgi:hypothetical protein